MRRTDAFLFAILFVSSTAIDAGDPTFTLGFRAPERVDVAPGGTARFEAVGVLTTSGLEAGSPGAQGWAVSLVADDCALVGITTDFTASADVSAGGLRDTGFAVAELTNRSGPGTPCDGRAGAVSAVVLSFVMPITLPAVGPADIFRVEVEASDDPTGVRCACSLAYANGCQGSGQPVTNAITFGGETFTPVLESVSVASCALPTCTDAPINLAVTDVSSGSVSADVSLLDGIDADRDFVVFARTGAVPRVRLFAALVSSGLEIGVQGCSLAGVVRGDGVPVEVSQAGTAAADVNDDPPGQRNTGFAVAELVDPAREPSSGPLAGAGPQGQGFVCALVLSFVMPIALPRTGTATVLGFTIEAIRPVDETPIVAFVEWRDGLQGSGQPVSNVATTGGVTRTYCTCQRARVEFIVVDDPVFLRCDPNGDGESDIADAVWIVNALFRDGPESGCADADDCNDDGVVDLSDATFGVAYQFQGGAPPPPPFPSCDAGDPTDDALECAGGGAICP